MSHKECEVLFWTIEGLVNKIGVKCRGRIEIERSPGETDVIEFESKEEGGWQRTGSHSLAADAVFSIFDEFKAPKWPLI